MKRRVGIFVLGALVLLIGLAYAHVDSPLLPEGCGSCHVGHGEPGEPMLAHSEEEFCYQCHGSETERSVMRASGRLAAEASLSDIEKQFQKVYRHPVVEGEGHSPSERLPDMIRGQVNHAECVDCHNPHQRAHGGSRVDRVKGYSLSGQYVESSTAEYEVCLKCHAGKAGRGGAARAVLSEFEISVTSQHPVSKRTSDSRAISLNTSLSTGDLMNCSDCHTNDDPDGPQGPHGSRHESLLSGRYDRDPYAVESPFAFEFCYSCHDRNSILSNESFSLHRMHIMGDPLRNVKGTSCYTCHASHSSEDNAHLLDFNPEAVTVDRNTGRLAYVDNGDSAGECYLNCHDYAHSPAEYRAR